MNVYFVDNLPKHEHGAYIHYFNKDYAYSGWKRIDIDKIISSQQEKIILSIEKWHTELCVKGSSQFKWWWLLPASRLILWHPPIWTHLAFALALAEALETCQEQEVYIVGCPAEVREYLREFCPKLQIYNRCKTQCISLKGLLSTLSSIKYILRVLVYIITRRGKKEDVAESSPIIIFTYGVGSGTGQVSIKDHFFGDIFDSILFKHPVHWVYYDFPWKGVKKSYHPSSSHSFVYDWIGISDWWALVRFSLFERCFRRIPVQVQDFVFNGYASKVFARNFASALIESVNLNSEFILYLGMKRILKGLSPRALVYPYEEKGMERALLMAVRECMAPTLTVGFAHAIYNKGFLYVRRRKESRANAPGPDKLMVTGPALKDWFISWGGWDKRCLFVAGSCRYQSIIEHNSEWGVRGRPLRVLILIGRGYEATVLLNQLKSSPKIFDNCEVIIRPKHYSWQVEQNIAYAKIKKIDKHIKIIGGRLTAQLSWCDVAVYCSTTAGVEAMLSGRLTVYLNLNHVFAFSSMSEKVKSNALWQAKDLSELQSLLFRISNMTKHDYTDIVACQSKLARQILQEINPVETNIFFKDNCKYNICD